MPIIRAMTTCSFIPTNQFDDSISWQRYIVMKIGSCCSPLSLKWITERGGRDLGAAIDSLIINHTIIQKNGRDGKQLKRTTTSIQHLRTESGVVVLAKPFPWPISLQLLLGISRIRDVPFLSEEILVSIDLTGKVTQATAWTTTFGLMKIVDGNQFTVESVATNGASLARKWSCLRKSPFRTVSRWRMKANLPRAVSFISSPAFSSWRLGRRQRSGLRQSRSAFLKFLSGVQRQQAFSIESKLVYGKMGCHTQKEISRTVKKREVNAEKTKRWEKENI